MSKISDQANWTCHGWEDHERGQLLNGDAMSFRERLKWLEEADRMVAWLETKRRWIDKDGVIHEPAPELRVAEEQAPYSAATSPGADTSGKSAGADPRG